MVSALVGLSGLVACTGPAGPGSAVESATESAAPPAPTAAGSPESTGEELQVGAAKIDVTPSGTQLPERYTDVLDPLFARSVAIQNGGGERAVLITVDAGGISTELWTAVTDRLRTELQVAPENVSLAATHTHAAGRANEDGYVDGIVRSASAAFSAVRPARMGFGAGSAHLNVNRNIIDKATGKWREGANRDGVSDKTVSIVSFQALNGETIAVYYNYAMHAVTNGMLDRISADYPGAASAYIEESLGGGAVAVFSSGAAGDQNPLFFNQTYELRDIRAKEYAERGEDISNALPPGGQGLDRANPRVAMLLDQQARLSESMGQLLGEEVLAVNRDIEQWSGGGPIVGNQTTISCPGRDRTDEGRAGQEGTYEDGADVTIRLSVVRIGDLYLPGVNGEVFNEIGQRLVRESPREHTILTTLTNGRANSGYIYSDAAADYQTFEVLSSRLKPGCAENAIVGGLLDLIRTA